MYDNPNAYINLNLLRLNVIGTKVVPKNIHFLTFSRNVCQLSRSVFKESYRKCLLRHFNRAALNSRFDRHLCTSTFIPTLESVYVCLDIEAV